MKECVELASHHFHRKVDEGIGRITRSLDRDLVLIESRVYEDRIESCHKDGREEAKSALLWWRSRRALHHLSESFFRSTCSQSS